ncbi:efflux RND transporter periplasmic adaptor subunit [Candidatus Electrothrix sp.]|uniref:efflux RND transporter periplasmic adaptor subunit n=1 Tax=Candidatus Electrothrix sp. TaxID=2170559 RepID=UPI0040573A52
MSNAHESLEQETDLLEKYHQLQANHYQLEDEHFAVQNQLRRSKRCYRLFFLLLIILGIGIGGYFWREELASLLPGGLDKAQKGDSPRDEVLTVKRETLRNTLSLTGKIEPLGQIDVVAPLEGKVLEKNFQYGDFVAQDTVLLRIDAEKEEANYQEAQAAYLEAEQELTSLKELEKSLEVVRIRHNLKKQQYGLKITQRDLKKTQRLLEKGIVSSSEGERLEEEYHKQQSEIAFLQQELALTLDKGSEEKIHVAELKKKNALLKMKAIKDRIAKAQLVSPMDGVVLLPVSGKNEESIEIQPGSFVKQDQVLFTIADLSGFNIQAQVDENDILKLQLGQEVTITGDAFQDDLTLQGTVQYISFQADREEPGKAPSFSARISVASPTDEQREQLLLGMSVDMEVLISEKPDAIIIPFAFVTVDDKQQAWVRKRMKDTGETKKVPVKIGVTQANTVEILEGLEVGDKIMREPLPPLM